MPEQKGNPKKLRSLKTWLLYTGIAFLFLIGIGVGYAVYLYDKTENTITESHEEVGRDNEISELRDGDVDPVEDNVSVLFLGVDANGEQGGDRRSDALLLATFNKEESSVKLLTIPRDSYVYIPEVDYYTKINHAFSYGEHRASIEAVESFLKVPVDYYVTMNFEGFVEVVDSLGGISFDVPYEMKESNSQNKKNTIHLYPGYQQVNGEEALALARTRKYDSDIARGKRQQEILKEVTNKATSASSVFKLEDLIVAVGSNMNTNLSFAEMRSFLSYGLDEKFSIEKINLDGDGDYMEDGIWYYHVEENSREKTQRKLRNHLDLEALSDIDHLVEDRDSTED
ncbi:LCP family protein [Virgibacillus sp. C22-A2]|uniref:LCP family protein n=1 Tax=Virgibacillus tibetensis TaxID=3042313 RepID=A0ABU6KE88_9BACI|nr:LCP family protein [Virgibacillus sp. C22-A2]